MKKNLYLYLFVFSALLFLFQWVSGSRQFSAMDKEIRSQKEKIVQLQDSLEGVSEELSEVKYFTLDNNEEALSYFDELSLSDPSALVRDQLMDTNAQAGSNPIVPFQGMAGDFKINRVQVMNHKFILADFSDGTNWGDMLIRYEIDNEKKVSFEVIDQILYPQP
ncbi:hydrolase [Aureicoccus marinus]|uniref:Hydrolase n=1 Tax=Aureicoccus marinus TaxID=754435 RepID=A0A2S7T577_9FLAO|nr:hydrolase [Aureicoccus marinus]PQJ15082.1 hydrolase [Aureicoccus marinus]